MSSKASYYGYGPHPLKARTLVRKLWLTLLLVSTPMWFPAEPAMAAGVMSQFSRANKAFEAGRPRVAQKILQKTLRRYPGHQPSRLLMARVLFRMGKVRAAARYFHRVPIGMIDSRSGYEFGIAMYVTENCSKANRGFAKVRPRSREYGPANFYRAVCAMRSRQWARANQFLRKARNLPANLRSTKRRLQRTIRQRLESERRAAVVRPPANPWIVVPPPPPPSYYIAPPPPAADPSAPKPKKKEEPPPPPPPPTAGGQIKVTPSVTIKQSNKTEDFHGFGEKSGDTAENILKLNITGRYDASPTSAGDQAYLSVAVNAAQSDKKTSGEKVEFLTSAEDPGTITEKVTPQEAKTARALIVDATPEVGYPLTSELDLTAGFFFKQWTPDGKASERTEERKPYGSVAAGLGDFDVKVTGSRKDALDAQGQLTKTTTTFGGVLSTAIAEYSLSVSGEQSTFETPEGPANPNITQSFGGTASRSWDDISLALAATQTTHLPAPGEEIPGDPASGVTHDETSVSVTTSKSFGFGASLSLTIAMFQTQKFSKNTATGQTVTNEETGEETAESKLVQANRQKTQASVLFKIAPVDWAYGAASYTHTQTAYGGYSDPSLEQRFQSENADLTTQYSLEVGLSKTF